jgi:histidinol dehydrogenase
VQLPLVVGLAAAKRALSRTGPIDLNALPTAMVDRTEMVFGERLSVQASVQRILDDVGREGDEAVRRYTRLLDGVELDELEIRPAEIVTAVKNAPASLIGALELSSQRIKAFHVTTLPRTYVDQDTGLGTIVAPLERAGIYSPGGTAAYPSTVLMTAIPAKVAGVNEVVLATPPRDGSVPANILVAASLAGVDRVFAIGGPQAIAAMAHGTQTVPRVDKVCGPGNIYVTMAKKLLFGQVGVDGLYGPTETILVADETANPTYCAADLIAQAEHDAMALPILVTTSRELVARVEIELDIQLQGLERRELATASLKQQGKFFLVNNVDEAVDLANHAAPEHLCLIVKDPWKWIDKVRHAGGIFLGEFSPEVVGDYVAGPSHVMPTGGSARFNSALGVHHFLRMMPVVGLTPEKFNEVAGAAVTIASAEGFTAHAHAIEVRLADLNTAKGL